MRRYPGSRSAAFNARVRLAAARGDKVLFWLPEQFKADPSHAKIGQLALE